MTGVLIQRLCCVLVVVLIFVGAASGDEKPKPLTPEQAADKVLAAIEAKDDTALTALAAGKDVDPRLVVKVLAGRGQHAAADSFAEATPGPLMRPLSAYAAALRADDKAKAAAALLHLGMAHHGAKGHGRALSSWEQAAVLGEVAGHPALVLNALANMAAVHRQMGQPAKAVAVLLRALKTGEVAGSAQVVTTLAQQLASAYEMMGELAKAVEVYERGRVALERLGDKVGMAAMLIDSGAVLVESGEFAKALTLAQRGRALAEEAGHRRFVANALNTIGTAHLNLSDFEKAISAYQRALAHREALGEVRAVAMTLGNIGTAYMELGEYDKSLAFQQRAIGAAKSLGDEAIVTRALANMGNVYYARGYYPEALAAWEKAQAAMEAQGDRRSAAKTLINLSNVHRALGDYRKALAVNEAALKETKALGDKYGAALILVNNASVYEMLGEYARALSHARRAAKSLETIGDKSALAAALGTLARVHHSLGDYATSLSLHERSLTMYQEIGAEHHAATVLLNIGVVLSNLGDAAKARAHYERALEVFEAAGDKARAADALSNIAVLFEEKGQHEEGLARFERVLVWFDAIGDKQGVALTLGNIGTSHLSLGNAAKALEYFERARAGLEALGEQEGVALQLRNLGDAHHRLGDHAKARDLVDQSAEEARSMRATPNFVRAKTLLAKMHLKADKPGRALEAAEVALDAAEQMLGGLGEEMGAAAREHQADLFAIGALAATQDENLRKAFKFMESGRAGALLDLLDKREELRWKAEKLAPELRKLDLDAQAAQSAARIAYDRAAAGGDLKMARAAGKALDKADEAVRAVVGRLQRELKQQAGLFYPRAETLRGVKRALREDQALVLYALCLDEALALVLRHDGERVVSLGTVADVTAACEALDTTDPDTDPKPALPALRKRIIEPLKLGDDVREVLVSPVGPLCYLPFGALFDRPIAMTPSGTTHVLLLGEERAAGRGVLALGDPDYAGASEGAKKLYYRGRTLSPLPASRVEVEKVGTTRLLGPKASEAEFRKELPKVERWRAVHFACHGLVNVDSSMLSLLALSRSGEDDGFLTGSEVLHTRIPADLAVLSACETATGKVYKGEGIVGLTRAFMFAGTPRVICSLWKVDDEATQALMIRFYELWNPKEGEGLGAAEALKKAQEHIRAQDKWKHPYYWAAWVLWGLPD